MMAFEGDWPGIFIRGDSAHGFREALQTVLDGDDGHPNYRIQRMVVEGLIKLLGSCKSPEADQDPDTQHIKLWRVVSVPPPQLRGNPTPEGLVRLIKEWRDVSVSESERFLGPPDKEARIALEKALNQGLVRVRDSDLMLEVVE